MYVPMPITDIALPLRHGMLYKKSVASWTYVNKLDTKSRTFYAAWITISSTC